MPRSIPTQRAILGTIMIVAGIAHFVFPAAYDPMIPDGLPKDAINYLSGALEIAFGLGVFVPRFRWWATLGIVLLMIVFLPVHVIDYFREQPAIGSKLAAAIRIAVQLVLIWWTWWVHRNSTQERVAEKGAA
ncbi:MAG: DoxX family membrane protein [Flavobacteriales bacterium]